MATPSFFIVDGRLHFSLVPQATADVIQGCWIKGVVHDHSGSCIILASRFSIESTWLRLNFHAQVLPVLPTSLQEFFDLGIDKFHVLIHEIAQVHPDVQRYD
jgi:hypothetical protein